MADRSRHSSVVLSIPQPRWEWLERKEYEPEEPALEQRVKILDAMHELAFTLGAVSTDVALDRAAAASRIARILNSVV